MNQLQQRILSIFMEIVKICSKNNISYYAIGGTCIGAVRHHGFVPWDDDMDIAVPIEQFDKFKECMRKELPEHLYLYDCRDTREYRYIFCKICDRNTTFVEESESAYPEAYKGVFVDVMPISGVPDGQEHQTEFIRNIRKYYRLNFIFRYPWRGMDNWKQKSIWLLLRLINGKRMFNYYSEKWLEMLKKYPFSTSNKIGYVWNLKIIKLIFPKDWFSDYIELPFENTVIRCPVDYDKYLTMQFGNYMLLPPEEERVQHHPYIVDLEHSYVEYAKKRKEIGI